MSTSETTTSKIPLEVIGGDDATELFVVDGDFQLVGRAIGRHTFELPAGIYKVKARSGKHHCEKMVVVREGVKPVWIEVPFASPIPLYRTAKTHEFHMGAAGQAVSNVHVQAGSGSAIVIVAREWTSSQRPPDDQMAETFDDPSRGLKLRDLAGNVVADIEARAHKGLDWEPWAICHVALDPGGYRLTLDRADGRRVEQTVVATPGWQTQVFLLLENPLEERKDRRVNPVGAAITMQRAGSGFRPDDPDLRLEEIAREALVQGRKILSDELRARLQQPDVPPMLGIFGMHLLIREAKRAKLAREENPEDNVAPVDNVETVQRIIANLRGSIGRHPDVEAIAIGADVADPDYVFAVPPMLRLSWRLLLKASVQRPEILPADSFGARIADRLWGDGPWLLWFDPDTDIVTDRARRWQQKAKLMLRHLQDDQRDADFDVTLSGTPLPPIPEGPSWLQRFSKRFLASSPKFSELIESAKESADEAVLDVEKLRLRLDPERRKSLVKQLGMPMATIDQWLKGLSNDD